MTESHGSGGTSDRFSVALNNLKEAVEALRQGYVRGQMNEVATQWSRVNEWAANLESMDEARAGESFVHEWQQVGLHLHQALDREQKLSLRAAWRHLGWAMQEADKLDRAGRTGLVTTLGAEQNRVLKMLIERLHQDWQRANQVLKKSDASVKELEDAVQIASTGAGEEGVKGLPDASELFQFPGWGEHGRMRQDINSWPVAELRQRLAAADPAKAKDAGRFEYRSKYSRALSEYDSACHSLDPDWLEHKALPLLEEAISACPEFNQDRVNMEGSRKKWTVQVQDWKHYHHLGKELVAALKERGDLNEALQLASQIEKLVDDPKAMEIGDSYGVLGIKQLLVDTATGQRTEYYQSWVEAKRLKTTNPAAAAERFAALAALFGDTRNACFRAEARVPELRELLDSGRPPRQEDLGKALRVFGEFNADVRYGPALGHVWGDFYQRRHQLVTKEVLPMAEGQVREGDLGGARQEIEQALSLYLKVAAWDGTLRKRFEDYAEDEKQTVDFKQLQDKAEEIVGREEREREALRNVLQVLAIEDDLETMLRKARGYFGTAQTANPGGRMSREGLEFCRVAETVRIRLGGVEEGTEKEPSRRELRRMRAALASYRWSRTLRDALIQSRPFTTLQDQVQELLKRKERTFWTWVGVGSFLGLAVLLVVLFAWVIPPRFAVPRPPVTTTSGTVVKDKTVVVDVRGVELALPDGTKFWRVYFSPKQTGHQDLPPALSELYRTQSQNLGWFKKYEQWLDWGTYIFEGGYLQFNPKTGGVFAQITGKER